MEERGSLILDNIENEEEFVGLKEIFSQKENHEEENVKHDLKKKQEIVKLFLKVYYPKFGVFEKTHRQLFWSHYTGLVPKSLRLPNNHVGIISMNFIMALTLKFNSMYNHGQKKIQNQITNWILCKVNLIY